MITTVIDNMKCELFIMLGTEPVIEEPSDDQNMYGVWVDDDLIGAGSTESQALADALCTAREWERASR